jgi:hypothetical protein
MSSLRESAIDLVNEAKGQTDQSGRLFALEQLREIVFHRDKTILKDILPEISEFMLEKSGKTKSFVVKFMAEALSKDFTATFPHFLSVCSDFIGEANDANLTTMFKPLPKSYERMVVKIVAMPVATLKTQTLSDPKQLWGMIRFLSNRCNDFLSSNRTEALRASCLRFCESQLIFALPPGVSGTSAVSADPRLARSSAVAPVSMDPRLARAVDPRTAASSSRRDQSAADGAGRDEDTGSSSSTAEDIPLHHAFINRNELQNEAEELFSKLLLWAGRGGPQGFPFSASLMSILGQVLLNVAALRTKNSNSAAQAVSLIIQGKTSVAAQMTGADREDLARACHRFIRAVTLQSKDTDGNIQKLRAAVSKFEQLGLGEAVDVIAPSNLTGVKRNAAGEVITDLSSVDTSSSSTKAASSGSASEGADSFVDDADRSAMVVAAVNAREKAYRPAVGSTLAGDVRGGSFKDGFGIAGTVGQAKVEVSELSADLSSLDGAFAGSSGMGPNGTTVNSAKLVAIQSNIGAHSAVDGSAGFLMQPMQVDAAEYSQLAAYSLKKLLDNYFDIRQFDRQVGLCYSRFVL